MSNIEEFLKEIEKVSAKYGIWIEKNEETHRAELVNDKLDVIATGLTFNGEMQSYVLEDITGKRLGVDIVVKKDYIAIHCYEGYKNVYYSTSQKCRDFAEAFMFLSELAEADKKYQELIIYLEASEREDEASKFLEKAKSELHWYLEDGEPYTLFSYETYDKPTYNPTDY